MTKKEKHKRFGIFYNEPQYCYYYMICNKTIQHNICENEIKS